LGGGGGLIWPGIQKTLGVQDIFYDTTS